MCLSFSLCCSHIQTLLARWQLFCFSFSGGGYFSNWYVLSNRHVTVLYEVQISSDSLIEALVTQFFVFGFGIWIWIHLCMCINTWQHLIQCWGICGSNKVSNDNKCDGCVGTCLGAGGIAGGHSWWPSGSLLRLCWCAEAADWLGWAARRVGRCWG